MWSFIIAMVFILAVAASVVTFVAFPYRGLEVPGSERAAAVKDALSDRLRQWRDARAARKQALSAPEHQVSASPR